MAKPPAPLPPEVLAAFERRQPVEAIKLLLALRANADQPAKPHATPRGKPPAAPAAIPAKPSAPPHPSYGGVRPGLSPGEVPRTSSAFWGWVVVALFTYLGWRLLRG